MASSELTHLASLFNKDVYDGIKPLLGEFPWSTSVAKELAIEYQNNFPSVQMPGLRSFLSGKMVEEEVEKLEKYIEEYKEITNTKELTRIKNSVFSYYRINKVQDILSSYDGNIDSLVKRIKDVPGSVSSDTVIYNMGEVVPSQVLQEDIGGAEGIIPSGFKIIRESTPFNGYMPGSVIQWVAAPGTGKSAVMLFEAAVALAAGFKVLYLAMGDLFRFDLITRLISVVSGRPYFEVAVNPDKYFTDEIKELASGLDFITKAANVLSVEEFRDIINDSPVEYDLIIADYDSNFKKTGNSDNMYHAGGEIYDTLTEIARPEGHKARVVFVACQPKVGFWHLEELPEESAGESSRKQHIIDVQVTLGRCQNSQHACGYLSLPKVRRGKPHVKVPYKMLPNGTFLEISKQDYALMKEY